MFDTGIFPDQLKIARVVPIHKSGDKNALTNYRPISVLPVLSKVFEWAINDRITKFLEKYNIISSSPFGFQNTSQLNRHYFVQRRKLFKVLKIRILL